MKDQKWWRTTKKKNGEQLAREYAENNKQSGAAWAMPESIRKNLMRFAFRAGYRAGRASMRQGAKV